MSEFRNSNNFTIPKVTIVIPCYNSGQFLPDALSSVKMCSHIEKCEVIIVNDGSTDNDTLNLLQNLRESGYVVIDQINKGPAAARNAGVKMARSEYVMFLDSDNKIRPAYLKEGIAVLNTQSKVGVVHGDAAFFGDTTEPRFFGRAFNLVNMFEHNYIDMCAMIRKQVWKDVGGLDENRILIGHEDWDFWLRVAAAGWKFHYISEILFEYRVRKDSLIKQVTEGEKLQRLLDYNYTKNIPILIKHAVYLNQQYEYYQFDKDNPLRAFIKYFYYKYIKR